MKKEKNKLKEKKLNVDENKEIIAAKDKGNMVLKIVIAILALLLVVGIGFDVSDYSTQDSEKEKNEEVEKITNNYTFVSR